jgi:hypothetical protein
VAAVDWPTFCPATVKMTVDPLRHPWPVALVVPPGEIAVGSTTSCFGNGLGGDVVGAVGGGGADGPGVAGAAGAVVVVAFVVVVVVAVAGRCRPVGFFARGRVVVVDAGGPFR